MTNPINHTALSPEELRKELQQCRERRKEILDMLKAARAKGDLAENEEYHAAKELQSRNESRIQQLVLLLEQADSKAGTPEGQDWKVLLAELQEHRCRRPVLAENLQAAIAHGGSSRYNGTYLDAKYEADANDTLLQQIEGILVKVEAAAGLLFLADRDPAEADRLLALRKGDQDHWRINQDLLNAYEKAANRGDVSGKFLLGLGLLLGKSVSNPTWGAQLIREAAEQGHSGAQTRQGLLDLEGTGTERDLTQAIRWFQLAAAQDNAMAQYHLGCCCEEGTGVDMDPVQAASWYRKAAAQGYDPALVRLARCYQTGLGVEKDPKQAAELCRKTAGIGDAEAQYLLGQLYEAGEGVDRDLTEAVRWYRKAAEQGHLPAAERSLDVLDQLAPDLVRSACTDLA